MTLQGALFDGSVIVVIFLAALGCGGWIMRSGNFNARGIEFVWLAMTLGLGLLSVGTMIVGMLGLLYGTLFQLMIMLLAFSGIIFSRELRVWQCQLLGWWRIKIHDRIFHVSGYILLLLTISTALWILLTHALMPPSEWDEMAYHLALPKLYVKAHSIIYVPYIVQSNWPMNSEMLYTIALLLGSDISPHLIMLAMTLLIALGIVLVSHRFCDNRIGIIAVALFLTIPLVKRLAGTGLIDVAPGLYVLAALVAFEQWRQERKLRWLYLCGTYTGFAAGSKLMGGAFPILLGMLVLIDALQQHPRFLRVLLKNGAVFGLGSLFAVGGWYARSLLFTGNPIWPFGYEIFGGRNWDTLGTEYFMTDLYRWALPIPNNPTGLVQSFVYLLTRPGEMGGYSGGLGVVAPVGALCASVLIFRGPRLLWQSLLIAGGFYLMWFAFVSHQLRFLLPIAPLMVLASGYVVVWLYDRSHFQIFKFMVLACLFWLVIPAWPWWNPDERGLLLTRSPYLEGKISRDQWLTSAVNGISFFRYANTQLPAKASILLLNENRGYYLDRDYVWGHPVSQRIIPFERFNSAFELSATLQNMGITHVIDMPPIPGITDDLQYWQHDRALMLSLEIECGEPLFREDQAVLYELTNCKTPVGAGKSNANN